jgi:hypothetical protein
VTAAGFYHSQTSDLAAAYRERVRVAYQASPISRCSPQSNASRDAWATALSQEAGRSLLKPVQFPRRPLAPVVSVVYRTPTAGCGCRNGLIPPSRTPYSLTPAIGWPLDGGLRCPRQSTQLPRRSWALPATLEASQLR